MSSKVLNVIAIELAILIGILGWLAFSNQRAVSAPVQASPRMVDFATAAPARRRMMTHQAPLDYRAEPAPEPEPEEGLVQVVQGQEYENEPPELEETDEAPISEVPAYADIDTNYVGATSPAGAGFDPDPQITSTDYALAPVDQFILYPQSTAVVVISHPRNRSCRPRSPGPIATPAPAARPRPSPRTQPPRRTGRDVGSGPKPRPQPPRVAVRPRLKQNP